MLGIFVLTILICFIAWVVISGNKVRKHVNAEYESFVTEHSGWEIYKSGHDNSLIAFDYSGKRIVLGTTKKYFEKPWSDISTVEIEKNGQSITQTNRGSQAMGAAVGAVLLGPVGLLVGGVTGSKRQKERINNLSLKVLIDDPVSPMHRITFFRMAGNGIDAQSWMLNEPAAKMEHFHALISNAIRQDDRSFASGQLLGSTEPKSVSDQIAKLWELKLAGALTQEEFDSEKLALLSPASVERKGSPKRLEG